MRSQSERRHYHFHEGRWEPLRARHHGAGSHYDTWNEPVQFEPDEAGIHPRQWFEKLEKLEAQVIAFSGLPNENLAKPLRPLGYRNRGAACTLKKFDRKNFAHPATPPSQFCHDIRAVHSCDCVRPPRRQQDRGASNRQAEKQQTFTFPCSPIPIPKALIVTTL